MTTPILQLEPIKTIGQRVVLLSIVPTDNTPNFPIGRMIVASNLRESMDCGNYGFTLLNKRQTLELGRALFTLVEELDKLHTNMPDPLQLDLPLGDI